MKHTLRRLCTLVTVGFALATLAQVIGLFSIPGVATSTLGIGFFVSGVITFMLGDYTWKPAFRVRRQAPDPSQPAAGNPPPGGDSGPDWTYSTRIK